MQYRGPQPVRKFLCGVICLVLGYQLSRFLSLSDPVVIFAVGLFMLFGAIAFIQTLFDLGLLWIARRRRREALNPDLVFGDARFASAREAKRAGLTDPNGLFLGRLGRSPLFFRGKSALLTVAPPRTGKGVSVVMPNLLHFQGSVLVADLKGELAATTASARAEAFGQKVIMLNPCGLHGLPQHRYNPLQPLIEMARDPWWQRSAGDEARRLALQLLPEPDRAANNAYFRNGSRKMLRALMLHLATWDDGARCTFPDIWRALTSPNRMHVYLQQMSTNEALGGIIQDLGADLQTLMREDPEHFGDFKEGALQTVEIYEPGGWLAETVSGSDVSLRELKEGRVSIYLIVPQDQLSAYASWLGIMTRQAISAVALSNGGTEVLFMLDEFGSMGKIEGIAESLTGLPGLGVRVWMIVQSLKQITEIYGPNVTNVILGASEVKQFFCVRQAEAPILSGWLGQQTVVTKNHSLGRSIFDEPSMSVGATGRPLMSAEEIVRMPVEEQLLFIQNLPPIRAERVDYRSVDPWWRWAEDNPVEVRPVRRLRSDFSMTYDEV